MNALRSVGVGEAFVWGSEKNESKSTANIFRGQSGCIDSKKIAKKRDGVLKNVVVNGRKLANDFKAGREGFAIADAEMIERLGDDGSWEAGEEGEESLKNRMYTQRGNDRVERNTGVEGVADKGDFFRNGGFQEQARRRFRDRNVAIKIINENPKFFWQGEKV